MEVACFSAKEGEGVQASDLGNEKNKGAAWETRTDFANFDMQRQILTCTECLERLSPNLLAVATFWKGCLQIKFTLTTSIASIHSPVQSVWPLTSWWSTLLKLTQKIPRYDINSSFEGV